MKIDTLLSEKQAYIVDKWTDLVLDSYESSSFFKSQQDRFANPVGANIAECLAAVFAVLASADDLNRAAAPLDMVVKIRAVQEFTPTQAVSFVFDLKTIIRTIAAKCKGCEASLLAVESRIDRLALMAFDAYMVNRERLHRIRLKELRNGTHVLTDGSRCPSAMLRRLQKNQDESVNPTV